jgi:hypothetical protein
MKKILPKTYGGLIGTRVLIIAMLFSSSACSRSNYTVIERDARDNDKYSVKVVLKHDGHKYFASCNNYKAAGKAGDDKITRCNLHVGDTIKCKFFPDRLASDAGGYDLICGSELTNGKLDTTGGNELLIVEKEEQ